MKDRMRRHSRRARHLIRTLRRSKDASVQDTAVHELISETDRRHGFRLFGRPRRGTPSAPAGMPGRWRPMTRRAKRLLSQFRQSKVWRVQKQILRALKDELENGRRLADKIRERTRKHWDRVRPRLTDAGRRARDWLGRAQEPMLRNAERKHAEWVRDGRPGFFSRHRTRLPRVRLPRLRRHPRWARRQWQEPRPSSSGPGTVRAPRTDPVPHYRPVRVSRPRWARTGRPIGRTRRIPYRGTR